MFRRPPGVSVVIRDMGSGPETAGWLTGRAAV
jgi:hypothetical protein